MAVADSIANMLTVMRNAISVRKDTVDLPATKLNEQILAEIVEEVEDKLVEVKNFSLELQN